MLGLNGWLIQWNYTAGLDPILPPPSPIPALRKPPCPPPPHGPRQRTSGLRRDSVHRRRPPAAPRRCYPSRAPLCAHHASAPAIHPASSYTRPVSRRLVLSIPHLAFHSHVSAHTLQFLSFNVCYSVLFHCCHTAAASSPDATKPSRRPWAPSLFIIHVCPSCM